MEFNSGFKGLKIYKINSELKISHVMYLREIQAFRNSKVMPEEDIYESYLELYVLFKYIVGDFIFFQLSSTYFGNTNPVLFKIKIFM